MSYPWEVNNKKDNKNSKFAWEENNTSSKGSSFAWEGTQTQNKSSYAWEDTNNVKPVKKEIPKKEVKKVEQKQPVKPVNIEQRPSAITGGRPLPIFDQKKLDKASGTAGAFTTNLIDSATLGLGTKVLNKIEPGMGDKELAKASQGHGVAASAGKLTGYLLPGSGLAKAAKPITKAITKPIVNRLVEGAIVGGGLTGIEDTVKGKGLKQTAKDVAVNTALGAGADLGLMGLGKVAGKILKPKIESKPMSEVAITSEALKEPPKINIPKPQPVTKPIKKNVSQFYTNSIKNSKILPDEAKKILDETQFTYNVQSNTEQLNRAHNRLQKYGIESEMNRLRKSESINNGDDSMSHYLITKNLVDEAKKTGNYSKVSSWLEETRPKVTNTAQALQALTQFKKSTPEGALTAAHNVVDNVVKEIKKTNPKLINKAEQEVNVLPKDNLIDFEKAKKKIFEKYGIPTLTNDENKYIVDTMEKAQNLQGRQKDIEIAKVMQLIANKIPTDLSEKIKGLQRISLLLNPKTNVRNILGNTILNTMENAKDVIGSPLDKIISLKTGNRTTLLPNLITQGKGMLQGAKETFQDAKLGIDTANVRGQYELPQNKTFNNGILNKLDKATKTALQLGDRPFYTGMYNDRLNQLMKINKVTKPTEDMIKQATEYAKDRTLQNDSNISIGMKKLQEGLNTLTGDKNFGIGNFAIPFTKTPGNILDKAISYSPLELTRITKQLTNIPKGTFNQKAFVDSIARSVTGTSAIMLGYDLAKKGYLTGKANKDVDVNALEQQAGKTPYSIKAGDNYYTVDWMQPLIIPLMVGADIYGEGKTRKDASGIAMAAVKSGGETLFKQSLLQGVQKLFGGYTPLQGIGDVAQSIPGQFTPSILKQAAQLTDKNIRNTYDPNPISKTINTVKAKIPGMSTTLQPKIDTLGREIKVNQGNNSLFNILVNPGTNSKYKPSEGEKMILDLYNKTGETTQFPKTAPNKIKGKSLSPQQVTDLQKEMGIKTLNLLNRLSQDTYFRNSSPEHQVKIITNKLNDIQTKAKKKILPKELFK